MAKTFEMITNEFRFYMLWNEYRDSNNLKLDVTNKDDVILAVRKAYIDMQVRTIDGLSLSFIEKLKDKKDFSDEIKICKETKETTITNVKNWLAEETAKIFKGEREFDHSNLCKEFLTKFISAIEEINKNIVALNAARNADENSHIINTSSIHFGKAQKIVNMTFKYLMLFDNAQKYEKIFQQCHMPIDFHIISYFNKYGDSDIKKSWSNFDEKEDYSPLQEHIKTYCKTGKETAGGTELIGYPLYDEFTIWHEGKSLNKK